MHHQKVFDQIWSQIPIREQFDDEELFKQAQQAWQELFQSFLVLEFTESIGDAFGGKR